MSQALNFDQGGATYRQLLEANPSKALMDLDNAFDSDRRVIGTAIPNLVCMQESTRPYLPARTRVLAITLPSEGVRRDRK